MRKFRSFLFVNNLFICNKVLHLIISSECACSIGVSTLTTVGNAGSNPAGRITLLIIYKMAKKRIYVPVSDDEYSLIKKLADADMRSVAGKAYQLLRSGIDDGMSHINKINNGK